MTASEVNCDTNENSDRQPPRLHIVGRRNAGKTTLVCELISAIQDRGFRVATVKHTHHNHELDTPGKDSFQHRQAGAAAVGILSPQLTALFVPETRAESDEMRYRRFEQAFRDCDLIVVEGDLNTSAPRVEVWRSTVGERPYAVSDSDIRAVVSDE
ncbi:MAG: molybdopterin-guanine dinucleotide biosynthesis protein B [Planctomycetaceae bacterium]|nr:molybdopterin-guanine dinucleotide biosynthesis protein B [Planctomycetaceae bacterium]